jgi:hypothetical protein
MNNREKLKALGELGCYIAMDTRICKWADERISELEQQLANATKQNVLLREFASRLAKQVPEKPDYWCSCGQCERNISDAQDELDATADLAGLVVCDAVPVGKVSGDRQAGMFVVIPHGTQLYQAKERK